MTSSDPIAAIERALEGVELVEWYAGGVTDDGLTMVDDGRSHGIFPITAETHEANFVAACNPVAITDLLSLARKASSAEARVSELEREKAEKDDRIAALEKAVTSPFCVVYLDGRNEHGTHVLPVLPASINEEADDIADQAEAIMAAAEAEGFHSEDLVWAEFVNIPPQIGDEGRIELAGYWEFKGVNVEMSALFNRRALSLTQENSNDRNG